MVGDWRLNRGPSARSALVILVLACLCAAQAAAAETVIYHDDNPSPRGWLPLRTTFTSWPSWSGSGHLARHVWTDERAELGVWSVEVRVDEATDWPSAQLEFAMDPGTALLRNCAVRFQVRGRMTPRGTDTFSADLGDLGDGRPGYRRVSVPMAEFAPSRDDFVGDDGFIERWFFACDAPAGTVLRIDEVRIVDADYWLPPSEEVPAVAFVEEPALEDGAVTFDVSDYCDVAVHILDANGSVVRHLAAGVLGENPPAPFQANATRQSVPFDGRDDRGRELPPGEYTVRVGLRLTAEFDRFLGEDPDAFTYMYPTGIQVGPDGLVYVLNHGSGWRDTNRRIWVYDRQGRYVREVRPPNPNLQPEYWNAPNPYKQCDVCSGQNRYDATGLVLMPSGWLYTIALDHGVAEMVPAVRRLSRIRTDGGGFSTSMSPFFWMPRHSELMYMCSLGEETLLVSDGSLRDEADSANVSRPSWFAPPRNENPVLHAVFSCRVTERGLAPDPAFRYAGTELLDAPRTYLGTFGEAGGGPAHFDGPRGVAANARGEIYVCDSGNNRLAVFRSDGLFLREYTRYHLEGREHPLGTPSALAIQPSSGALYLTVDGPEPPARGKRLVKLLEEGDGLRALWAVDLHELTGYQIAVDTSAQPTLVWTLLGDGFATVTRIEDLGERAGAVTHFGGRERWGGMVQCPNLAVDAEGTCYAGRYRWQRESLLYAVTRNGELQVSSLPSEEHRWVSSPGFLMGPEGRLCVLSGRSVLRVSVADLPVTEADIETVELASTLENVQRYNGLAVDEEGDLYTIAFTKEPGGGKWEGIDRHIQKFSATGEELVQSCIPILPGNLRSLAVRKGAGVWVFSGQDLHQYGWDGTLRWHVGGFRFRFHEYCGCPRPDFSVDDNRYAWVSDMGRIGVFVLDANGNQVTRVGSYGNRDCRGPGSQYPLPEVPLNNPRAVVATDEYVWIQDYNHQRIVRCRLGYEVTGAVEWSQ